jgi:hypothetical protein
MVVFNRPEISPPPSLAEYQYHEVEDQLSDDLDDLPPPIPISQLMNELEKNLATSSPSLTHDFTNHLSSSHVVPNVRATSFLSQPPPHLRSTPVLISSSKRTLNTTELQSSDSFPTKNLNKGATQAVLMGARTWHFKAKRSTINNDRNSGVFRKTLVPPSGTANSVAGSSEMGLKSPLKIPPLKEDVPLDIQFQDEVVKKPITEDLSAQVKELAKLVRTTMNSLSSDDIEAQTEDFTDPQYKKKKKKKKVKKKNNKQSSNTTSCKDGDEKEEEEESDEEEVVHPSHHHDPRFLHLANSNFKFIEMLPDRVKHVTFQHDFSEALDAFKHKQYRVALTELTKCFPIVTSNRNYALLYFDRAILHGCLNNLPRAFEDINEAIRLSSKVHNTIPSIGDRSPQEQPFSLRLLADFFFCRSVLHRMSGDYLFAGNDSQMAKQLLSSISTTSTSSSSTDSKEEDDSLAFEEEKLKKLSLTEPAKLRKESKTNEQIFEDACETPPKVKTM